MTDGIYIIGSFRAKYHGPSLQRHSSGMLERFGMYLRDLQVDEGEIVIGARPSDGEVPGTLQHSSTMSGCES